MNKSRSAAVSGAAARLLLKLACGARGQLTRGHAVREASFDGVAITPFRNAACAAAVISADFELSWAWQIRTREECERIGLRERDQIPFILRMLDQYQIPITWATVGHLFLESCSRGVCGRPHPGMPRPPRNNLWGGEWYRYDPCSDMRRAPGWYAPDLIHQIQVASVRHEIGTHSFSHIDFSPRTSTPELVQSEMEACINAMGPFNAQPRSLVFCFNHMGYGHSKLLARLGITSVRHRDSAVRLSYPERTSTGIYKVYESMNLRRTRYYDYVEKARMFVDEAVRRGAVYHLWFHPSDSLATFNEVFAAILAYLDAKRKKNLLWVTTMGDLAAYCEARERTSIRIKRGRNRIWLELDCDMDVARYGDTEITLAVPVDGIVRDIRVDLGSGGQKWSFRDVAQPGKAAIVTIPCRAKALEIALAA